ncbi:MAG: sel1 repeat family protein [Rhodospirillaceae bacterium]|nr:sel1 repeat family protein [Rhodospirillaceae bacterium]
MASRLKIRRNTCALSRKVYSATTEIMTKINKLQLAAAIMGILAFALIIRSDELGYAYYYRGEFSRSLDGLIERAKDGEPTAAMLLGFIYTFGKGRDNNYAIASGWYIKQVQMGDIKGIRHFLHNAFLMHPVDPNDVSGQRCRTAINLLELAARAGDLGANIDLGRKYRSGSCVEQSAVNAARYFRNVSGMERQLSYLFESVLQNLTKSELVQLKTFSAAVDVKPSVNEIIEKMLQSVPVLIAPN